MSLMSTGDAKVLKSFRKLTYILSISVELVGVTRVALVIAGYKTIQKVICSLVSNNLEKIEILLTTYDNVARYS